MGGSSAQEGVAVQALEQVGGVVASIADFQRRVLAYFALKAKAPGLDLVRPKVVAQSSFIQVAGIEEVVLDDASSRESGPNIGTCWDGWQRGHCAHGWVGGGIQRLQEAIRRRSRDVQEDVVERRIVEQPVPAADSGLAMAGHEAAPLRGIGEADAGAQN